MRGGVEIAAIAKKAFIMKKAASRDKNSRPARGNGAMDKRDARMNKGDGASAKGEKPIHKDREVQDSNDEHIDQDYPNFPDHPSHRRTIHNGSAGAFDATEHSHDEEDEDQDSDDFAMDR